MKKEEAIKELEALKVRQAELQAIIGQPIAPEERFIELINGLEIKFDKEKHPRSVFFFKGDKCFLEIENSLLYVRYEGFWTVFEDEFCMNYEETQAFIKNQVETHFKISGLTPSDMGCLDTALVETHFKISGLTPCLNH